MNSLLLCANKITWIEYVHEFELIAFMIPTESQALYLGNFMNGLKDKIKIWVGLLGPNSRLSAINIARNVEVALKKERGIRSSSRYKRDKGEMGHTQVNSQFKTNLSGQSIHCLEPDQKYCSTQSAHTTQTTHTRVVVDTGQPPKK